MHMYLSWKKCKCVHVRIEEARKMSGKLVVIGLDGATWTLLDLWISQGRLPTFARFINSGIRATLKSTIPSTTCPALPSLFTGVNSGNTGIFSFTKPNGSPINSTDIKHPTIWNILDMYNYRSCVVDVRMTFPPEKLNGIMICGSPIPTYQSNYTYPEDLESKIISFRDEKLDREISERAKEPKRHHRDILKMITKRLERRYRIFRQLNQNDNFDFPFFWIGDTDFIQHLCWSYKKVILQFYIYVDKILEDITKTFPKRNIIILSDHGFQSPPDHLFLVNTWLHKERYLVRKSGPFYHLLSLVQVLSSKYISSSRLRRILRVFRRNHKHACGKEMILDTFNVPGINVEGSSAYLATNWGIKIVCSENYDSVRDEIIEKLEKLRGPEAQKVIKAVWKKEEIFSGKYLEIIPDIVFIPTERYHPSPLNLGNNVLFKMKGKLTAKHRYKDGSERGAHLFAQEGILIAFGPAIKRGKTLSDVDIVDVAPTILHMIGCRIPENVDGKVLLNMFREESEPAKRNVQFEKRAKKLKTRAREVTREEEEKILERLRELGYL